MCGALHEGPSNLDDRRGLAWLSHPPFMVVDVSGTLLADLERDMAATDFGACSDEDLAQSLRRALGARQVVDGFVNRLAGEARRREATGAGSPAQEVIRSGGVVSNREARALDRRAGVGETLPTVGRAGRSRRHPQRER